MHVLQSGRPTHAITNVIRMYSNLGFYSQNVSLLCIVLLGRWTIHTVSYGHRDWALESVVVILLHQYFDHVFVRLGNEPWSNCYQGSEHQYLEQGAVGFILPLIFQVPYINRRDDPFFLGCCVQYNLKSRKTYTTKTTNKTRLVQCLSLYCKLHCFSAYAR